MKRIKPNRVGVAIQFDDTDNKDIGIMTGHIDKGVASVKIMREGKECTIFFYDAHSLELFMNGLHEINLEVFGKEVKHEGKSTEENR